MNNKLLRLAAIAVVMTLTLLLVPWVASQSAQSSSEKPIVLNVDNDGTLEFDPATAWQAEQFEKMHPNIKINFVVVSYNNHQEKLIRMASGAEQPLDVWAPTDAWIPDLKATGIFLPIDQIFPPEKLSLYTEWQQKAMRDDNGNIVGVPIFGSVPAFMYRPDLLKAAGFDQPPTTWDELMSYAIKLTDAQSGVYGFVDTQDSLNKFWHWLFQAGGEPFDTDGNPTFNSPAGVTALKFLVDLRKSGVVPPGAVTWMTEDEQNAFILGKVAMSLTWAYGISNAIDNPESEVIGNFAIAPFPKGPGNTMATVYEDNYYMIPKTIDPAKLDAALAWLDWVSSYPAQVGMLIHEPGNYVPIPSAYEDAEVLKSVPFVDVLKLEVLNAHNVTHLHQGQIEQILLANIQSALLGQMTPQQALDDAAAKVSALSSE